jgi:dihydroorotate dehydrogenase
VTLIESVYKNSVRPTVFAESKDNAEIAHRWGLEQLKWLQTTPWAMWLANHALVYRHPMLAVRTLGLNFDNPLGLAAGYDKYCDVYWGAIPATGWGFCEVGGITPLEQEGFPEPRMLRNPNGYALWNQMGFNNPGAMAAHRKMLTRPQSPIPVGLNIGKGKNTPIDKAADDYVFVFKLLCDLVQFVTINISSPNTKDLRELQAVQYLLSLILAVQQARHEVGGGARVGIKISPDETDEQLADIVGAAQKGHVDFMILTNTTVKREGLNGWNIPADRGGVSGRPVAPAAKRVLSEVYRATKGKIPLIGVGGICNSEDLYDRIRAGATLCQVYTAWPYEGPDFVKRCLKELVFMLRSDGFANVQQAVGADI